MRKSLIILLALILSVMLGAIADGLNENGKKNIGHPVEAAEKIVLLMAGVLSGSLIILFSYIAFRVALFDIIKNLAKGDKWSYLGDSSWWDRFVSRIPTHGMTFIRVIFLAFAVGFTINEFQLI